MPTRRDVLRGALPAGVVGAAGVQSALAQEDEEDLAAKEAAGYYDQQPNHVYLRWEPEVIDRYRPLLDLTELESPASPDWLYAWVARSAEWETACACYWAWYSAGQDGVVPGGADAHVPDREPVYVWFKPGTGQITRIAFDAYHYLAGFDLFPPLFEDTHPKLHVIAPWHPYRRTQTEGEFVETRNLHRIYDAWLANEWAVNRRVVVEPWRLPEYGHWWRTVGESLPLVPDSVEFSTAALYREVQYDVQSALPGDSLADASEYEG